MSTAHTSSVSAGSGIELQRGHSHAVLHSEESDAPSTSVAAAALAAHRTDSTLSSASLTISARDSNTSAGEEENESDEDYVVMLSEADVAEMRSHIPVRELRYLIRMSGGESRDCVEKADLFLRYLQCLDRIRLARQRRRRQSQRQHRHTA